MDKIAQTLFKAEYNKLVKKDKHALAALEDELMKLFQEFWMRTDIPSVRRRVRSLDGLPLNPSPDTHYLTVFGVRGVVRYPLTSGEKIYKIPVFSFNMNDWKDHWTTLYLIVGKKTVTLVDSGTHLSEKSLEEGLEVVRVFYGESVHIEDIDNVILTHAHFDHFGGLHYLLPRSKAKLWVHEWDVKTIEDFPKEKSQGREQILRFLKQAGMPAKRISDFMEMHGSSKETFPGYPVTHPFKDGDRIVENYQVIHTPGHCPGLSCIRVGDVMFLGDQVLNDVSPHQFPKIYTSGSGLQNYFNSLIKISSHSETIRVGLPSHYGDIPSIESRAMEIMSEHNQRIADIMKDLDQPKSLYQVSDDYYRFRRGRELRGYDNLLAQEEIGAHLEFMIESMGIVKVTNPEALGKNSEEVVFYQKSI
ncbi:MAG: MBL fold metallo-hydrolase [SAR324 cluster bacterium]|nr:MBL fold metallo-hydrolase [SAR324 cluster bacterium]